MGAGKGGVEPIVLKMDLHCAGCAHKVKKAIKRMPGVESIVADVEGKRIVVAGTADAAALKARIEAKTSKAVEVVFAAGGPKEADKEGGAGEKEGDKDASPKEAKGKEKKQPPGETKPKEDTVLLKIRLHCDACADRIRRRIYKFRGVKDVVLDGNAKDEVKVAGTMDVPALLAYLKEKLNRPVDAVAPGKKKDGGEGKDSRKDKSGDSDKDAAAPAAGGGGEDKKGKAKGIDAVGPSTAAAAAAFMAPPAEASTYHVPPPYGYVGYPQGPVAPTYSYPDYGNADGMGYSSNPSAATYYQQEQQPYPYPEASQPQGYPPYPYRVDMAPPSQLFSDENPNACSVM